jgi:site-specific recombinase XerD
MAFRPERAREVLPQVDPARLRWGWPVGLRDGALLALLAAGVTTEELAELKASAVTMERSRLRVALRRHGVAWFVVLSSDLGGHVLAWLTERRLWGTTEPVFTGIQGPLSPMGIHQILHRYRHEPKAPR